LLTTPGALSWEFVRMSEPPIEGDWRGVLCWVMTDCEISLTKLSRF
jgi:hypothetical protein